MPIIREQRTVGGVGPVGVVRMNTGASEKYGMIADAADRMTKFAIEEMGRAAVKTGEQAAQEVAAKQITTINPITGKPEALDWVGENRFFGRTAADAYERVIQDRFQLSIENEIKTKAGEIALQYENNPYAVERYESQMNEYLKSMALGSEQNGKPTAYTNFIVNQGSQYIAATKLNMMQKRNALERAKTAQALAEKNAQDEELAYNLGVQGQEFTPFLDASTARNTDGEESAVLPRGTTSKQQSRLNTAYVNGSIQRIFKSASADEGAMAAIELAIRTDGLALNTVPEAYRAQVEQLLPYISRKNKNTILQDASAVAQDYRAVTAVERAKAKAQAETQARQLKTQTEASLPIVSSNYMSLLSSHRQNDDIISAMGTVDGYLDQTTKMLRGMDQQYVNGLIEESERDEMQKVMRESFLNSVVLSAAADGNIDELKAALNSRNPEDMVNLSAFQREIVRTIAGAPQFMADRSYINGILEGSKNDVRIKLENSQKYLEINSDILLLSDKAQSAALTAEEFSAGVSLIANSTVHSDSEKRTMLSSLRADAGKGLYNSITGMTSAEANALNLYIATDGKDDRGLPVHIKNVADSILNVTTPAELDRIKSHGASIESSIRQDEQVANEARAKAENYARVASGGGYSHVAEDRKIMDDLLRDRHGVNFADPKTLFDDTGNLKVGILPLMQRTIPEGLVKNLNAIADGLPNASAPVFLDLFANLSNTPSASGIFVDRFGDSLSIATKAFLNDVNDIRNTIGGNPVEIGETLRARRNDPISKNVMESTLKKKSPYEYALAKVEDPYVASRLAAAVEYHARTGKDAATIDRSLDDMVEKYFPRVDYIADPRMPLGSLTRSENSLQAELNGPDEVKEFVRIINEQLPEGYVLQSDKERRSRAAASGAGAAAGYSVADETRKQVYLVPDKTSGLGKTTFFAYFVDDKKELQPLIISKPDGSPMFVAFDDSELNDYREQKRLKEEADIQQQLDQEQQLMEALRKRPGQRFGDILGD